MTSCQLSSIEGLKKKLITLQRARPDLIEAVKVLQLPYSRLHYYTFTEDVDIMVLCHSVENRPFAITNVTDSLYDEFLNYCNKELGKERIAVIAHDFSHDEDEVRAMKMDTFKNTQWSTFEKAGLVMICGRMDKTPEIQEKDWNSLVKFLEDASKSSPANDSVKGLKEKLQTLLKQSFSKYEIRELVLPYNRLEDFNFPLVDRTDAMILCHSVQSRGFSITDVPNSIYDEFLKYCNRVFGKLGKREVTITLMTSCQLSSIEGLKKKLITLQRARPDLIEAVKVLQLPYSRLHYYTFTEDVDIMVLCHSVENRPFAITNVTDSLYDEFLNYCNKELGKERIAVIAHDFSHDEDEVRAMKMDTFKNTQWSTFEKAGLVMICGRMDKTPEIQEKDWNSLVKFLEDASKSSPANGE
eukprot:XP_011682700.1 PREDICTED: uncharacterized protein LOC105446943 [Strongylocentrotus purpuratus]